MVRAVRGAIVVANTTGSIESGVKRLITTIVERNGIASDDLISIVFSQTRDLVAANPATALRTLGYGAVPLFCTQEPDYAGSMPGVVRALVTFNTARDGVIPVYLDGAERLRNDLFTAGTERVEISRPPADG